MASGVSLTDWTGGHRPPGVARRDFTFLGPHGAGKTTTVEILGGHRKRTPGDVKVLGEDPSAPIAGGAWPTSAEHA